MLTKPSSITLHDIEVETEQRVDRPLFSTVESDSNDPVVSDPETLSDAELNMYGSKLPLSDGP
jgi:hypothetical protein